MHQNELFRESMIPNLVFFYLVENGTLKVYLIINWNESIKRIDPWDDPSNIRGGPSFFIELNKI